MPGRWVVLKFGGTSVSAPAGWDVIARRAREVATRRRAWIVASALAGVSDRLESAVAEALAGDPTSAVDWIATRHRSFLTEVGAGAARPEVDALLGDLARLLEGARLTGEASPRLRARVLSCGELLATRIGVAASSRDGSMPATSSSPGPGRAWTTGSGFWRRTWSSTRIRRPSRGGWTGRTSS